MFYVVTNTRDIYKIIINNTALWLIQIKTDVCTISLYIHQTRLCFIVYIKNCHFRRYYSFIDTRGGGGCY